MLRATPALALLTGLMSSCGGSSEASTDFGPRGNGGLTLEVTDAPFAHGVVSEARLWVDEIQIRGPGGFRTLHAGSTIEFDLAGLRNGVTQELVSSSLPVGSYDQVRLVISDAYLRLIDGDEFSTAQDTLHLTSTANSGLKLNITPPLAVQDGVARTLLLDFDLTKTFKAVPGNDPLDANWYQLLPVVKVSNLSQTGELRGAVREDDGTGQLVGLGDATVYVLAPGEDDLALAVQTTASEADGNYVLLGVDPGTYDIVAQFGAREERSDGRVVVAGSVTIVDFVLP